MKRTRMRATTVVAIRYADGVVMAGDRRATEGYSIAQRAIEKVFPADRHSGVSIGWLTSNTICALLRISVPVGRPCFGMILNRTLP